MTHLSYFGETTAMHVLMEVGMGLPTIKPDIHMMEIFFRIGLVDRNGDIEGTCDAAGSMAADCKGTNWMGR